MTVQLLTSPTDEQTMLVDASVRFMEAEVPFAAVRASADGAPFDAAAYGRGAAELGWLGMLAEEAAGGGSASGNGVVDAALLASERGARLQPGPFAGHTTVVHALTSRPTPGRAELLEALVAGRAWATWAFDAQARVELRSTADGLRLHGTVPVVAEADRCAWLLVAARAADGPALVLVEPSAAGVSLRRLEALDVTRTWCRVGLDDVAVEHDAVIAGPEPTAEPLLGELSAISAVLTAAESVGAMHADVAMAVAYAKERTAFGRPIGSFQALKHMLADTSLHLEMAKGLVAAAAEAVGDGAPDGAELAHAAKAFVAEQGVELAHTCFQVFGGIGYTWEHDQHLYLRRLAADAVSYGDATWHRSQLLDLVEADR